MSHTKEPWAEDGIGNVGAVSSDQWNAGYFTAECGGPDRKDNARRIVACVNACAGVGTETLELMAKHHAEPLQHSAESNLQRIAALEAKVRELEAELETERMRLAGCGVAALGYFDGCKDEYKSASLGDVLQLRDQLTASRQQVERLVGALEKIKLYRAHNGDTWPADVATEALSAVEKELKP